MSFTKHTHDSVEMRCACVMAETARTSSSSAVVYASGAMRMSEPLPLERSPSQPRPSASAVRVALPTSNALPSGV